LFYFHFDHIGHAAAGRGERHADIDAVAAGVKLRRCGRVDETEVDDVDGNLGVAHGPQLLQDHFLAEGSGDWRTVWVGWDRSCHINA
jgi:hypothetical protein